MLKQIGKWVGGLGSRQGLGGQELTVAIPPSCVQDSAAAPACICAAGYSGNGTYCSGPAIPMPRTLSEIWGWLSLQSPLRSLWMQSLSLSHLWS